MVSWQAIYEGLGIQMMPLLATILPGIIGLTRLAWPSKAYNMTSPYA